MASARDDRESEFSEPLEIGRVICSEKEGAGSCFAGIHGETDVDGMKDREKRVEWFKEHEYYRGCIPCDRCGNCIELRKFGYDGVEKVTSLVCTIGCCETTAWHTCNQGRRPRNDRRKVIYDLENAPLGFKEGLAARKKALYETEKPMKRVEEYGIPKKGYVGGSEKYKRKGKERGSEGSVQMPKGLVN